MTENEFQPVLTTGREPNAMDELCSYMLEWTAQRYNESEGTMSPEVYDRAVSFYGIAVPMTLLLMSVAAFICVLGAFWRGVRK